MQEALPQMLGLAGAGGDASRRALVSVAVVIVLWLARFALPKLVNQRVEDARMRYRIRKGVTYTLVVLGVLLIGSLWIEGVRSLATFLGLVSAGLAIALSGLVQDVAGWVFIVWRRPFKVGERVEIGQYAGDVMDIRVFQFSLLEIGIWVDADQSTGRVIHVPCGAVLKDPLANVSRGLHYIWNEIPVVVTSQRRASGT